MKVYLARLVATFIYRLLVVLFPFQTKWLFNRLLRGSHGFIVSRLLGLSMDYIDTNDCQTFVDALASDFSSKRFSRRKVRSTFRKEVGRNPVCWLDVSYYYRHDDKTGLHRRMYEQLRWMLKEDNATFRVIAYDPFGKSYRYANALVKAKFPDELIYADPVVFQKGDTLVLMQAAVPTPLGPFVLHGVKVVAMVDDVIQIQHPELSKSSLSFEKAFREIVLHSSLILSVSKTAINEIIDCIKSHGYLMHPGQTYDYVYNGSDFKKPRNTKLSEDEQTLLNQIGDTRFVFSVGTFEPRKGYQEEVAAFEKLWKQGSDLSLVIAGRTGVKTGSFVEDCKQNPEYGKHLFLAIGVGDQMLATLYEKSLFVLNCSKAEGFGIPLMEATFYQKAVLARRLPVFEEIMTDQARYFEDDKPEYLAGWIKEMAQDVEQGKMKPADPQRIPFISWKESGEKFARLCKSF